MYQKGFTLVELAIVLVIIGLLVGGVLQGQELIKQAQIRAHIKGVNDLKLAIATFQTKYDALPGDIKRPERFFPVCDATAYGIGIISGNGDGKIDVDNVIHPEVLLPEYSCVWLHLTNAGLYQLSPMKENELEPGVPPMDINFETDIFPYAKWPAAKGFNMRLQYWRSYSSGPLLGPDNVNSNGFYVGGISNGVMFGFNPADMYSIDSKMDDGKPASGIVRALGIDDPNDPSVLLGDCYDNMFGTVEDYEFWPTAASEYTLSEEVKACRGLFLVK